MSSAELASREVAFRDPRGGAPKLRGESRSRPTARELEVLRNVIAEGNERAAAHRMGIHPRTVNQHMRTLRERTGARNRTELAWRLLGPR